MKKVNKNGMHYPKSVLKKGIKNNINTNIKIDMHKVIEEAKFNKNLFEKVIKDSKLETRIQGNEIISVGLVNDILKVLEKKMRKIKLDGKIHNIDISDGKGLIPFGMNGGGGMSIYFDNSEKHVTGRIENTNCLDGKINYTLKKNNNFYGYPVYIVNDKRYIKIKEIKLYNGENVLKMDKVLTQKDKINNVLLGLKYENINYINEGYHFGKEITYDDFCIVFDNNQLVVFTSDHKGFIAADYLSLTKEDKNFNKIYKAIKKSIMKYFEFGG